MPEREPDEQEGWQTVGSRPSLSDHLTADGRRFTIRWDGYHGYRVSAPGLQEAEVVVAAEYDALRAEVEALKVTNDRLLTMLNAACTVSHTGGDTWHSEDCQACAISRRIDEALDRSGASDETHAPEEGR